MLSAVPRLAPWILLLLLSAADAALVNSSSGSFTVDASYVLTARIPYIFIQTTDAVSSGSGVYVKGLISTAANILVQTASDGQPQYPVLGAQAIPLALRSSQASLQTCIYVTTAAGLAALNATNFTTTCPTLTTGVAVATVGSKWTAQCTAKQTPSYVDSDDGITKSYSSCLGSSSLPTSYTNTPPAVYQTAQFGPAVTAAGYTGTFYEVYFVYAVIGGTQGQPVNITLFAQVSPLTALSPPPPVPAPRPPSPSPPTSGGGALRIQLAPVVWGVALVLALAMML